MILRSTGLALFLIGKFSRDVQQWYIMEVMEVLTWRRIVVVLPLLLPMLLINPSGQRSLEKQELEQNHCIAETSQQLRLPSKLTMCLDLPKLKSVPRLAPQ